MFAYLRHRHVRETNSARLISCRRRIFSLKQKWRVEQIEEINVVSLWWAERTLIFFCMVGVWAASCPSQGIQRWRPKFLNWGGKGKAYQLVYLVIFILDSLLPYSQLNPKKNPTFDMTAFEEIRTNKFSTHTWKSILICLGKKPAKWKQNDLEYGKSVAHQVMHLLNQKLNLCFLTELRNRTSLWFQKIKLSTNLIPTLIHIQNKLLHLYAREISFQI